MIYSPREDSYLIAEQVRKHSFNKKVLDIGTGSGILAKTAIEGGAKSVLASDIDPESIQILNSQGIKAVQSNLFSNIKGKFDLIIFNPPYLPEDSREPKDSKLTNSGGKYGDEIILKFLKQSTKHLTKEGKIILLYSSLTPQKRILSLMKKLNLKHSLLSSQKIFFEELSVILIEKQK